MTNPTIIPAIRIFDSYAIAVAWHAYANQLGYIAQLQRWGRKWKVTVMKAAS